MNNLWLYEAEINKLGSSELVKKLHLVAGNMFDANHILMHYVYDDESEFNIPIEIGSIKRLSNIENVILNLDIIMGGDNEDFDGSMPLEVAKDLPDDQVINFKCECKENLRVPNANFPFVTCPNCNLDILRREIKDAGGYYFYEKSKDNNE